MKNIIGKILGGDNVVKSAFDGVKGIIDEVSLSGEERAKILESINVAQIELNKKEAGHRTVFVAGWRPFIGWVCGVALAYNFIIRDLFIWIAKPETIPPALQMDHLITVLTGMLGLAGLRTFEKVKGISK